MDSGFFERDSEEIAIPFEKNDYSAADRFFIRMD
jgi:hypothetical protein